MFSAKMMQNITKIVGQTTKNMTSENKAQSAAIGEITKAMQNVSGNASSKVVKDLSGTLQKIAKLAEAQIVLLSGLKPEDMAADGDDKQAELAKELAETIKRLTDENKKQAADIDSLLAEVAKAAKEGGDDKDASKKIKTATAALEKAVKLIDEQSKLLDEARKAMAA